MSLAEWVVAAARRPAPHQIADIAEYIATLK
jgi:hypothetical protein